MAEVYAFDVLVLTRLSVVRILWDERHLVGTDQRYTPTLDKARE